MSYETVNNLQGGVSPRQVAEFLELLGYERQRSGAKEPIWLTFFNETDYRSWATINLWISSKDDGSTYVHTHTNSARSFHDFEMQNRTVRELRRRFGGTSRRDGGDGSGYEPGPPVSPPASGCYLAMSRLDWNLGRIEYYLRFGLILPEPGPMTSMEISFPRLREMNPEIFVCNVLRTYLVSAMEDFFKGIYVALLRYSDQKAKILKGARLSGDQLAAVSNGTATLEGSLSEVMPFQRLTAIEKNFKELDPRLDILAPLRRPYRRRSVSLFQRLDDMVTARHSLIHGMELDLRLDRTALQANMHDLTVGLSRVYVAIGDHYGWKLRHPVSSVWPKGTPTG